MLVHLLYSFKGGIHIIVVDLRNPKPIYEQIRDNIKQLIMSGALAEDERLPSVRELAQTTSINPNTIQKAYRELEAEGFIYSVAGIGNFVAAAPKEKNPGRIESLKSSIRDAASELLFLGVSREEIMSILEDATKKSKEDAPK